MADVKSGQRVQVLVEGLVDLGNWPGHASSIAAKIVEINPVTKMITVVFDQAMGDTHSLTVPPNRVRAAN